MPSVKLHRNDRLKTVQQYTLGLNQHVENLSHDYPFVAYLATSD